MTTHPKKVLGRGLGALIPQKEARPAISTEIEIDRVDASPVQPRKGFDEPALDELAQSIRVHGIVQPLLVSRAPNGRFQLIAGERRLRAARKAGLRTVPAVIKESVTGRDSLELALIENIQRQDLNPLEEALAYQQLHNEFGLTQEEIAKRVGKERSTVANLLRLLRLPDSVKRQVASGELSMGHARALLGVEGRARIEQLAETVIRRGLNVRQTELLVSGGGARPRKPEKRKDVFTREAEEKLTRIFRTKIEIDRKRRGGGTIRVHYSDEEELMRLFDQMSGRKR